MMRNTSGVDVTSPEKTRRSTTPQPLTPLQHGTCISYICGHGAGHSSSCNPGPPVAKPPNPRLGSIFLRSNSDQLSFQPRMPGSNSDPGRFRPCRVRIRIGFAGPGSDSDLFFRAGFGFGSDSAPRNWVWFWKSTRTTRPVNRGCLASALYL